MRNRFFLGLDLGQQSDFTALAVLQKTDGQFVLRQIERTRGQPYPKIADEIGKLMRKPELRGAVLAVDETGVGRPVVELLRRVLPRGFALDYATALASYGVADVAVRTNLVPVTITGGHADSSDGKNGFHVPKKNLIASAMVLFQERRLVMDPAMPHVAELVKELQEFQVKITMAGNETFGAWRESKHDDLVFALALASWAGLHLDRTPFSEYRFLSDEEEDEPRTLDDFKRIILRDMLEED